MVQVWYTFVCIVYDIELSFEIVSGGEEKCDRKHCSYSCVTETHGKFNFISSNFSSFIINNIFQKKISLSKYKYGNFCILVT